MERQRMNRVSKDTGRAVIVPGMIAPSFYGGGNLDFICSSCEAVLAEQIAQNRMWDLVIECRSCNTLSEFPRLSMGTRVEGYVFFPEGRYHISQSIDTRGALMIGVGVIQGGGTQYLN